MPELMICDNHGQYLPASHEAILSAAQQIRESNWVPKLCIDQIWIAKDYFSNKLADLDKEVFVAFFLDSKHRVIAYEELAWGTLDKAIVYRREVAKAVLKHQASAIMVAHNHPGGDTTPSDCDRKMTEALVQAMDLIDCRVLDHIIVGVQPAFSFAEHGYI